MLEALSFYEYCELAPSTIAIKYTESPLESGARFMMKDIKEYFRFFRYEINSDQDQNTEPYIFNNTIYINKKSP